MLVFFLASPASAQKTSYVITGKIIDNRSKEPVIGTAVRIANTTLGASSDATGNFKLTASLAPGNYQLAVSSIGFKPFTRQIVLGANAAVSVNISVEEDLVGLNEVVVTGNSVATSRKQLGNAIGTISAKDMQYSVATSIDQAMAGKISGAQISQNSGNPAGGISVRLRGSSTIVGSSDPLYIVDGVIINNSSPELLDLGGYAQNRLVDINPADIDRIEVIKGAAAAAIFGSRASNGVVQIFTKKGKEGKPQITFSTQYKSSQIRKKLPYNEYPFNFVNTTVTDLTQVPVQRYDYQDAIFRTASGTENNISISGGSQATQYFFSGNYLYNQGIIDKSDFSRGGARLRLSQTVNKWLQVTGGVNYSISGSNEIPNGGINEAYGALTGFIFSNNFINPQPDPVTGVYPSTTLTAIVRRTNPLEAINRFQFQQRTSRIIGDIQLQATPFRGFNVNYVLGYDNANQIGTGFIPTFNTTPTYAQGFARRADQSTFQINNDITASYKTKLTDWLESTTGLGGTAQQIKSFAAGQTGTQLGPFGQTVSNAATQVATESRSTINIMGVYLQQTFGLYDKVFVTGAGRYDVSSIFGANDRAQFYPKLSGSYLISAEDFWKNSFLKVFSTFKLRTSYGQAGNLTAITAYQRYTNYNPVSVSGLPGVISPAEQGSINIKPERQIEKEYGVDMGLFNDRVSIEFTYYNKDVKDLILARNLVPSSGYLTRVENIGNMSNKGLELLVRAVAFQKEKFIWSTTVTFQHNANKVFNIPGGLLTFPSGFGQVAAVEGQPLGVFYSTYFARNPDGSLLYTLPTATTPAYPQRERSGRAANGQPSGTILNKVIGNPNPQWTASWINEFTIGKKLTLRAQLDAVYGNDVFNFTKRVGDRDFYGGLKGYETELRGEVPKGTSTQLFGIFENWIEDGSFVKLREVSASYQLNPKFLGKKSMRITLAGRNIFSIDNYSGWDPEVNAAGQSTAVRGFDFTEVPIPRTITAGVSVNF